MARAERGSALHSSHKGATQHTGPKVRQRPAGRSGPVQRWPSPDDFERMTPAEFNAYLERNGFAVRIAAAMAETDVPEERK